MRASGQTELAHRRAKATFRTPVVPRVAARSEFPTSPSSPAIEEQLTDLLQQSGEICNSVASMSRDTMGQTNKSVFAGLYGEVLPPCSSKQMILRPILSLLLLGLTACGDFQDPSLDPAGSHETIGTPQGEHLTIPTGGYEVMQADAEAGTKGFLSGMPQTGWQDSGDLTAATSSMLTPMDPLNPSSASPATQLNTQPDFPISTLLQSGQTQQSGAPQSQPLPWASAGDNSQPAPVQDSISAPKLVTVSWDPSMTSDVLGYKVLIISASGWSYSNRVTAPMTELQLALPRGQSYLVTVTAYNAAGESPPATYVRFDNF